MKHPTLKIDGIYRILAVHEGSQDIVGRLITIEKWHVDVSLPPGYLSIKGKIHGSGETIEANLAVAPEEPATCHCSAFAFPHKIGPRCLAALT